jgi:hypothetical protein
MIATGGTWDRNAWPVYFLAGDLGCLEYAAPLHRHILVAVNELERSEGLNSLHRLIVGGAEVLIDSGIFWLASTHAAAHGMGLVEAFGLAPDQIDGFDRLFNRYIEVARDFGDRVWGYIELDLGGRENKIKTRAKLEALGLRPIPVFHPLNDGGWDYFDHLAESYDRVCYGNLVNADQELRRRLMATMWERCKKFPHLWVHVLGFTPNEMLNAYPLHSGDSSSWLSGVRFGQIDAMCANQRCWNTGRGLCYDRELPVDAAGGHRAAWRLGGYESAIVQRTTRILWQEERDNLECEL